MRRCGAVRRQRGTARDSSHCLGACPSAGAGAESFPSCTFVSAAVIGTAPGSRVTSRLVLGTHEPDGLRKGGQLAQPWVLLASFRELELPLAAP